MKNTCNNHGIKLSNRPLKTVAWPARMYGCESWTRKKEDESRIQAFEDVWVMKSITTVMDCKEDK